MPRRIEAIVKPELLVWGRASSGLELEEAAHRASFAPEQLALWEAGGARPTVPQLHTLARVYHRPFAAFYLPSPPPILNASRYFRRVAGAPEVRPSPELAFEIREAESRREIALELADQDEDEDTRSGVPRATLDEDAAALAERVRTKLGVSLEEQLSWRDEYDALNRWRTAIEQLHVLVFQVSGIGPDEMRGFSVYFDRLPIIGINSKDSPRARSFSLLHELAHLVLGEGDVDRSTRFWLSTDHVETFCNSFAGYVLVPEPALAGHSSLRVGERADAVSPTDISVLTARFRVSEDVILLRLLRTNRISRAFYDSRRALLAQLRPAKTTGGPPFHRRVLASYGRPFVRTVLSALARDRITLGDVSDYLGVKLDQLPRLQAAVRLPYSEEAAG